MDGPSMPAPRSSDGAKEPGATRRDGLRGKRFWLLWSRLTKVARPGRAKPLSNRPLGKQPGENAADSTVRQGDAGVAKGSCLSPEAPHHLPGAASSTAP